MSIKSSPSHYKDYKDALDYQTASRFRNQLYSSPSSSSSTASSHNLSKKLNISASVTAIGPIQSPSQSQFDYRYKTHLSSSS